MARMGLATAELQRAVVGFGARSAPVAVITYAPLAGSLPAPTLVSVPPDALFAEFQFAYTAAAGSTNGLAGYSAYVGDGTNAFLPFLPSGYGIVDGPTTTAGLTVYYVSANVPVAGWTQAGVSAAEDGDAGHHGALVVTVVWVS